ncbi:type II secretion system F family protein [Amaricoccus sp.]|uniref:type II secretion system F family protein n=1 Tax=Amaricoccus sp. TaxID=1872485 RepID=UPI00263101C4|nr:type II secretion system F family protein [Amaricoccus sp.]HRO11260.1 type II secretion system F family protein [Amaricoccus sp.]
MSPIAVLGLSALLSCLLLVAGASHWLVEKRARLQRVRTATGKRAGRVSTLGAAKPAKNQQLQQGALAVMRASTRGFSIMKGRQVEETRKLLVSGGFRSRDAIVVYTFFKLVTPLVFLAGAALYVYGLHPLDKGPMVDLAAVMAAALLGSKLPDLFVKNVRTKRLESIRKALPDSLDMLVICTEAGLASDAALKRVVAETGRNASALSEELNQTALELAFMPERRQALENLTERAPLPSVNAFANTMIQAEKYGTPLARAFKVLSQEQRNERMMRAEEKAGRLPATMTVPMMLFILPALFIVLIGPAILDIMDNFIGMGQ